MPCRPRRQPSMISHRFISITGLRIITIPTATALDITDIPRSNLDSVLATDIMATDTISRMNISVGMNTLADNILLDRATGHSGTPSAGMPSVATWGVATDKAEA